MFEANGINCSDKSMCSTVWGLSGLENELFPLEKASLVTVPLIQGIDNMANVGKAAKRFLNVSHKRVSLVAVSLVTGFYCITISNAMPFILLRFLALFCDLCYRLRTLYPPKKINSEC